MKLASIERIHSIKTHPNADSLLCAKVLSWPIVIKKGEFKEGELVVFFPIDVLVDYENPYFKFLEGRKFRIWNAKFRGEPSCGLVCPLSILNYYGINDFSELAEGQDIGGLTKTIKYETADSSGGNIGQTSGGFTNLISVTDEDNYLSNPKCENEFRGEEVYTSVKIDGQSHTILNENGEIKVFSRKLQKRDGRFWDTAKQYDLPNKLLTLGKNIAIQSEQAGEGIQKNKLGIKGHKLFVFNVKDLDTGLYYGYYQIKEFCEQLNLDMVPLIDIFKYDENWDIDRLQKIANELKYSNGAPAEGLVCRTIYPKYSSILRKMLSVKIVNQNY
jgi:RNA ligase (TIGR02306 family)